MIEDRTYLDAALVVLMGVYGIACVVSYFAGWFA